MKKFNLLIAAGLFASVSMQAQTVIASLGFEENDTKGRSSDWAITPGKSIFGDWVNVKDQEFMDNEANNVNSYDAVDAWNEKYSSETHSGSYAFQAVNTEGFKVFSPTEEEPERVVDYAAATWDRGFKIAKLPIQQDKSYRVSFWIKGDEGARCSSWLSQGIENFDASVRTANNYKYGIDNTELSGEWQFMSFVAFVNSDCTNQGMESWTGGAKYPEIWGGDGSKTYRQFYEDKLPEEFFFIVNMFSNGATYLLDDIKIEEDVYINKVYFNYFNPMDESGANVLKLDLGYQTNAKALAEAAGGLKVLDTETAGVTVTVNGEPAEVKYVEAHDDGFVYIFLDEDELTYGADAKIVVSYTPSADSPLLYEGQVRPSADITTPLQVKGFTNEEAWFDESIDAVSNEWTAPTMVSAEPADGSFELDPATLNKVSVKFDKAVSVRTASASLRKGETTIPLASPQLSADDLSVVEVAVSNLEDGEYTFVLSGVRSMTGIATLSDVTLTFAVGEDHGTGTIETVWTDNIRTVGTQALPAGWSGHGGDGDQSDKGGLTAQENLSGAPRAQFPGDASEHGIYISGRNSGKPGTLAYGKLAIEAMVEGVMPDEAEPCALKLTAGKYDFYYQMALWDQNNGEGGQAITMAVYDAQNNAVCSPKALTVTDQLKGSWWDPNATWVSPASRPTNGVTTRSVEVTIPEDGYYYVEFATNDQAMAVSYFLLSLRVDSKPSSEAAAQKARLAAEVAKYQPTMDQAEDEKYNGATKTAFVSAFNNAKNGRFTSVSAVDAVVEELEATAAKMQTRIKNYDDFATSVGTASDAYDGLEGGKYQNSDIAQTAKALIEQYSTVEPSTLSDEQLAEAAPKLVTAAAKIANVKDVVDALTWRAYKAGQTADLLGVTGTKRNALDGLSTDDTEAIDEVNALSTIKLYKALAENINLLDENESLKTTVYYENDQKVVEDDEVGYVDKTAADVATSGIDFTSLIRNPKFYTWATGKQPKLADDVVTGWMCDNENNAKVHADPAATEAKPVITSAINAYGDAYKFYQVITDAPVGVYDVYFATRTAIKNNPMGETGVKGVFNAQDDATGLWDKYIFATVEDKDGTTTITVPFAAGGSWFGHPTVIPGVKVTEGATLTIGAVEKYLSGKASGHNWDSNNEAYNATNNWETNTFVGESRMYFVAPLEDYDYAKAAEDMETSIEDIEAATAAKNTDAIYNLAGQRVDANYKGVVIINGKKVLMK